MEFELNFSNPKIFLIKFKTMELWNLKKNVVLLYLQ